jgi:hypothetical protein
MPNAAIKLPAALEKLVASQLREGTYRRREAAIVATVSHQKHRSEQLALLQSEIQKGLDSGPAGELDIGKVIRRGRRWLAARARRARSNAASNRILACNAFRFRPRLRLRLTRQSTGS